MRRSWWRRVPGLAAVAVAACGGVPPGEQPWPDFGGVDRFAARAMPVLTDRCANPGCHGRSDRPLSLYAVYRHRLDPDATYRDKPLSVTEVEHNFRQTAAFLIGVERPSDSLLIAKPRSLHGGVRVFPGADDYDARRLRAWIASALADGPAP